MAYKDNTNGGRVGKRFDMYTPEERKIIHDKSIETRKANTKRRKALKELLEIALTMKDEDGVQTDEKIIAKLITEALDGKNSIEAFKTIRDTVGEKPKDEVELSSKDVIEINIDGKNKA